MIKVLIVEDSPVVLEFLVYILSSDPEISVVGTARNGEEAIKAVSRLKPDIITMDINMPKMNGFEATRRIMETHPTPIVIVSGSQDVKEVSTTFNAIAAGALTAIQRPTGIGHPDHERTAKALIQTVKLMSEVKVVRRWHKYQTERILPSISIPKPGEPTPKTAEVKLIAIGASTGGPPVLETILSGLKKEFPIPMLIVQHIAYGFTKGFAEWLNQSSGFPVQIAEHDEYVLPCRAYIAPDGFHLGLKSFDRLALSKDEQENGLRPAVSYLFRSVAKILGKNAIGVLLTGMGKDGAEELKLMKETGAITIVQDEESSVVYGMPGEAVKLNAVTYVFSPENIARFLSSLASGRKLED